MLGAGGAAAELAGAELTDPVGEAEIYLAYGRHERAIEILQDALRGDPAQSDVRLKLMEIHDERGEQQEFMQHYAALGGDATAQRAAREALEHGKNPQWLAVLTTGAAALAAVGMNRGSIASMSFASSRRRTAAGGSRAAPEQEFELGALDDADLDVLAAAAAAPQRSHQETMLAKTGEAIARAAAELDLGVSDEFELGEDVSHAAGAEDLPDFDLPLGELELGAPDAACRCRRGRGRRSRLPQGHRRDRDQL